MDESTRNNLIALNKAFYEEVAESFSETRQGYNPGWMKVLDTLPAGAESELTVLDIGCGNARFKTFLDNNLHRPIRYVGVDFNDLLLQEARLMAGANSSVEKVNIFNLDKLNLLGTGRWEVVGVFGVTHHVPGAAFRKKWFEKISEMVNYQGVFAYTFWDIGDDPRSRKLEEEFEYELDGSKVAFTKGNLDDGDHFYGWRGKSIKRYVHVYSELEKLQIRDMLAAQRLKLVNRFSMDGKNQRMNDYWIWRKS